MAQTDIFRHWKKQRKTIGQTRLYKLYTGNMLSEREANSYNIFVNPKIKAIGITIKMI